MYSLASYSVKLPRFFFRRAHTGTGEQEAVVNLEELVRFYSLMQVNQTDLYAALDVRVSLFLSLFLCAFTLYSV